MVIRAESVIFLFLFKGTYAKGNSSSASLCICPPIPHLQHILKNYFRLSTFNRDAFFRGKHVTWSTFNTTQTKTTYSGENSAFDLQPRCLFQGGACQWSMIIAKRITTLYSPATSGTSDFESQCLRQGWAFHVINNFTIWYDIHTKRITKLITPARYATSSVGGAWLSTQRLRPYFSSTPHAFLTKFVP